MQLRRKDMFTSIRTEGAILPSDLLQRIAAGEKDILGLSEEAYHLSGERISEAVNRSWNRLQAAWKNFQDNIAGIEESEPATRATRERWLLPLFQELGYGRLLAQKSVEFDGKSYPVSHGWQHTPIHLVGCRVEMDRRMAGVAGAARMSPHSMVQEYLNRNDGSLWGFVSNGLRLRLLRDSINLTRQAYVEFDLEALMEGEIYADFVVLWLICHQSRVEAENPAECWLEKWSRQAQDQGTRALDQLRQGVEKAITAIGEGFLSHPENESLRERLRSGNLHKQDYYRQILRFIYRLIFLYVAEDRDLLLDPKADTKARERYLRFYSLRRIREFSEKKAGSRHSDIYHGIRLVMEKVGTEKGCPELALPALGSRLFLKESTPDLEGLELGNRPLLSAIRAVSFITHEGKRRSVDFKNLGSEELGSIYESLLELHPDLCSDTGAFALKTAGGHERKTTGSYYTPSSLVQCLLDSALEPVLAEAMKKEDPEQAILNLKVCDPACGSGHFLVAAAHRMAKRLAAVRTGDEEPAPAATRKALRDVIGRCIYGVDINPMAVELCQVSLWLEAMDPEKPLSFLDHHIRCGNSLLGTTPALLRKGIPDEAFKPIEGDDKKYCSQFRKMNKNERSGERSLFDAAGAPWERLGDFAAGFLNLDTIDDSNIEGVRKRQELYEQVVQSSRYQYGRLWADAWCAAFVWVKKKNDRFPYPITEEIFRRIEKNPHSVNKAIRDEIQRLSEQYHFFHWHLAFPDVFRLPGKDEKVESKDTGWNRGFDCVLGNPPWERVKLQEKEWFAERQPNIANAPNAAIRKRLIEALRSENPILNIEFQDALRQADGESHLVRNSSHYPLCGRGDINLYAVFAERMRSLLNPYGRVGCILPSGIATDDTTKYFFRDVTDKKSLVSLFDFENRSGLFPSVDSRMKFCLLTLGCSFQPANVSGEFAFFAHQVEDLKNPDRRFSLTAEEIARVNPNSRTCPIFRSRHDAEIAKKIYNRIPVLYKEIPPEDNPWGIKFVTMFHMTNDSDLFRTREQLKQDGAVLDGNIFQKADERWYPVYEGKMIGMFNHRAANIELHSENALRQQQPALSSLENLMNPCYANSPYLWGPEPEGRKRTPPDWRRDWFLAFKRVTSSTNERTIIGCIMPWTTVSYTLYTVSCRPEHQLSLFCLAANLFSLVGDYLVRQKTSQPSLPMGVVYETAFLAPMDYSQTCTWSGNRSSLKQWILPRILELTYTAWDLEPFARDFGWSGPPFRWDEERRFLLRCELDAAFFHLYSLSREDAAFILEAFPTVKRRDEEKFGEYRTKRIVLEIFDEMAAAISGGKPYATRLDPPPADYRCCHGDTYSLEVIKPR